MQINYEKDKSNNENYKELRKKIEEYREDNEFENEITKEDISYNGKVIFDDFNMATCDFIFSNLRKKDFKNENIYINFYRNVCEKFYKKGRK